jgi:nucleoside-diphosphate-sugar epimerase
MTMPNVVLTGASGFVGTAMVQRLKVEGLQVSAVYRSQPATQEEGMVSHVLDIGPEADWSNVLQECDIVIHLAARVHVMKDTVADPLA